MKSLFVLLIFVGNSFCWFNVAIALQLGASPIQRSNHRPKKLIQRTNNFHDDSGRLLFRSINHRKASPFSSSSLLQKSALQSTIDPTSNIILSNSSFFLGRVVFLKALGFIYAVAFLVAKRQNKALIGDNGITPARRILNDALRRGNYKTQQRQEWLTKPYAGKPKLKTQQQQQGPIDQFFNSDIVRSIGMMLNKNPTFQKIREVLWDRTDAANRPVTTILWFAKDWNNLDPWLDKIATIGLVMSLLVFLTGAANVPLLLGLWICQRSIMAVGGPWYSYGWEPQLAELGFHALFLVPVLSLDPLSPVVPSPLVLWCIRWYLFRIMMGAGLIKFKSGDPKWKFNNLSVLDYFFETQPVPNPLTRYFHWLPKVCNRINVLLNHFVEVIAPFFLLIPFHAPILRRLGGIIQIIFQFALILAGNLSFLNWLTAIPAILCLDDQIWSPFFSKSWKLKAAMVASSASSSPSSLSWIRVVISRSFWALVIFLSAPVVQNLLSKQQKMNTSHDRLRLINSYGAFGVVSEHRDELIISAATDVGGPWEEYEFKVKPGNIMRSPKFISPYHYRLDWQLWICGNFCRSIDNCPWMYNFLYKLLDQDQHALKLLENDPFSPKQEGNESEKPRYIRVDRYRYKFHKPTKQQQQRENSDNNIMPKERYWDREFVSRFYPRQGIATKESLKEMIEDD